MIKAGLQICGAIGLSSCGLWICYCVKERYRGPPPSRLPRKVRVLHYDVEVRQGNRLRGKRVIWPHVAVCLPRQPEGPDRCSELSFLESLCHTRSAVRQDKGFSPFRQDEKWNPAILFFGPIPGSPIHSESHGRHDDLCHFFHP